MAGRKPGRRRAREQEALVRDLERLAELAPGGAPERPVEIESPAQVEPLAAAHPCPLCDGTLQLEEHAVEPVGRELLRVARLRCISCGVRRQRWFRVAPPALN